MSSEPVRPAAPAPAGRARSTLSIRKGPIGPAGEGVPRVRVDVSAVRCRSSITALGARPDRVQAAAGDVVAYLAGRQTMT